MVIKSQIRKTEQDNFLHDEFKIFVELKNIVLFHPVKNWSNENLKSFGVIYLRLTKNVIDEDAIQQIKTDLINSQFKSLNVSMLGGGQLWPASLNGQFWP
ncbi:hypothetical protein BpHYR1_004126 [Brachionus plicatilis]|uniref:Uncharacterized protein n=1 Tax=Brachionus plicatilis TaxID=10195 RepID=A0A3M7R1M3_BRAPC|nr:hypothetical protein BpHYR1_004126 [Brachionus plicatilis]